MAEIQTTKLVGGINLRNVLGERYDSEYGDVPFEIGSFEVLESGQCRIWRASWAFEWKPTSTYFPGPISAIRAILRGEA